MNPGGRAGWGQEEPQAYGEMEGKVKATCLLHTLGHLRQHERINADAYANTSCSSSNQKIGN